MKEVFVLLVSESASRELVRSFPQDGERILAAPPEEAFHCLDTLPVTMILLDGGANPARDLAQLLELIENSTISGKIAKGVFDEMAQSGKPPETIVQEKGLVQITDSGAVEKIVSEVIDACPREVEAYKNGKTKLLGFFVGQVMQATRGKANPKLVNEILKKKLES